MISLVVTYFNKTLRSASAEWITEALQCECKFHRNNEEKRVRDLKHKAQGT